MSNWHYPALSLQNQLQPFKGFYLNPWLFENELEPLRFFIWFWLFIGLLFHINHQNELGPFKAPHLWLGLLKLLNWCPKNNVCSSRHLSVSNSHYPALSLQNFYGILSGSGFSRMNFPFKVFYLILAFYWLFIFTSHTRMTWTLLSDSGFLLALYILTSHTRMTWTP